ncbi:MAG: prepilin-type N-terminal cleavage/methylation domain-containing protein [Bdellovibrionales bacterium]|nr:prepilin-type N-terminal cleavage/methylation domain-containing protein [Bdellovibrionales bacterium]
MVKQNKKTAGFTLLEIMISVTILAFISLFTSRMISQGVKAKGKIQADIDRTSALNAALSLISKDIEQAFNYRDVNVELHNAAQTERRSKVTGKLAGNNPAGTPGGVNPVTPGGTPALSPEAEEEFKLKEEIIYTQFMGEVDKLNFTSLNNFRPVKNLAQSEQSEIGYYLENCSSRIDKKKSSQCLWRRTSPIIDEDVTDGGNSSVLIENVKSLQFRYLGPGHEEEWVESWKSKEGEEITKNKFPTAVEVTLVILDTKFNPPREIAMTVVAPLRFPNNKKDEKSAVVN